MKMNNLLKFSFALCLFFQICGAQQKAPDSTSGSLTAMKPVAFPHSSDTLIADSVKQKHIIDSLKNLRTCQINSYLPGDTAVSNTMLPLSKSEIFRTDATSPSEIFRIDPRGIQAQTALSSYLNRYLLYGNVAPVDKVIIGNVVQPFTDPLFGTDQFFSSQMSNMATYGDGSTRYTPFPCDLVSPEAVIFWENGVFGENILNFRFSRPLTHNLKINVFSNYKHFDGKTYNHDGNSIYSIYSSMFHDTSRISHTGYTPLINEQFIGTSADWQKSDINLHFDLAYADAENELILDSDAPVEKPVCGLYNNYPLSAGAYVSGLSIGKLGIDAQAAFLNESIIRHFPLKSSTGMITPVRQDAKRDRASLSINPFLPLTPNDTAGSSLDLNYSSINPFNSYKQSVICSKPVLKYIRHFRIGGFDGELSAHAGAAILNKDDSTLISPLAHGEAEFASGNKKLNIFIEKNAILNEIPLDTVLPEIPMIDDYYRGSIELQLDWKKVSLLIGYQYLYGVSDSTVSNYWLMSRTPYQQPRSSILLAPELRLTGNFSLNSKLFISEKKPYIKSHSELSFSAYPMHTAELVDLVLGFDYWSPRDPVTYTGTSDWNRAIYNLNFETAVQIKTFRLFYKIDNLLNQKYAYIPGYYMPGITFRWGINWFIQR
jgi:hypothetical protein